MSRSILTLVFLLTAIVAFSQSEAYIQQSFCKNLNKVFELGRNDNFESYDGTLVKQSPFLPVPGYAIKLEKFAINYADKDNRFVAKTNLSMDSLSALQALDQMKQFVGFCLDTVQWKKWEEVNGDDKATVFLTEFKELRATSKDLNLTLTILVVAPRVYSIALYVKRH